MSGPISIKRSFIVTIILTVLLIASCAAPPQAITPATATQTQTSSPSQTQAPTQRPAKTITPTATAIPGFEDWSVFNPSAVDIKVENGALLLTLKYKVLWFMDRRGELVYKPVSGDFKITAQVHTAKSSDPAQPPGGDGSVQLGGLMARNENGSQENYVFIVVGDDGDGLSVETKNTTESVSKYEGPAWDSRDAELRLCRVGQTFNLYKRHVNTNEAWTLAASFDRPDLPNTLQVGATIYTDSEPDLTIRYDHIMIEHVTSKTDCEKD